MYKSSIAGFLLLALVVACVSATGKDDGYGKQRLTAPVYEVVDHGVSEEEAKRLGEAFGLGAELEVDEQGVARYVDAEAFLAVPVEELPGVEVEDENAGPFVFESFDYAAMNGISLPEPEGAAKRVDEALQGVELLPREAWPVGSQTRLEAVSSEGEPLADLAIATDVSYRFELDGLPLEGPGAKIRVSFADDERITQFLYSTRRVRRAGELAVVDEGEARERCATWTAEGRKGEKPRVTRATLAYYAEPLSERIERLEPRYRCETVHPDGARGQVYFVPAAVEAARPGLFVPQQSERAAPDAVEVPATGQFGRIDVGSEGTGPCSGLPNTATNLAGFNNRMTSGGVTVQFSWVDSAAWEDDWKDNANAGHDSSWVDDVDMAYWQGHGTPTGFSFSGCSSIDDTKLSNADARWGNRDLEWASLFTCSILQEESGGQRWWQRWRDAFHRLHQINSFDTVSYHSSVHGQIYANYLVRNNQPLKVRQAWAHASIDDQPQEVVWATMGVMGSGGLMAYNDHFWGKGGVAPDVPPAQVTGWWRVSGNS